MPITPKDTYNADVSTHDIVDEAIQLFRATILFKNFKVQGPGDRMLIYLTCFIQKCLEQMTRFPEETKARNVVAQIVGDAQAIDISQPTFFMNKLGLMKPGALAEKRKCTDFMKKCMDETAKRLLEVLFRAGEGDMNRKFWMGMGKKPFLGQKFVDKQYSI